MPPVLSVRGLEVAYGAVQAVRGLDLDLEAGGSLGVIGANGAGKTSTLKAILGLVPRRAGRVAFDGRDLGRMRPYEVARLGIGYVPEGRRVFGSLTVRENLLLGGYARPASAPLEEVYALFPDLAPRERHLAGSLSGGQQQMLAIGRALVGRPRIVLLDEPSMGLAPRVVQEISAALARLVAAGLTLLLVEQNAALALGVTERCLVLERGRVALAGRSEDLRRDDEVRRLYLGM